MNEQMEFPETWEEYEQEYGFNDSDEVYTNNSRLIQSFRVKQWLDHLEQEPKTGHWILTSDDDYEYCTCSECGYQNGENWMIGSHIKYCQECGTKMQAESEDKEGGIRNDT